MNHLCEGRPCAIAALFLICCLSQDDDAIPELSIDGLKPSSAEGAPPPRKLPKRMPTIITPLGVTRPARMFEKLEAVSVSDEFKILLAALDYIVTACRDYVPHSGPFLRPVLRLEAPTYYDVIKTPMDLGTLASNLEEIKYFTKSDFARDLQLIFTNCRLFNDPTSIYVQHADELEKLAIALLRKVPDYDFSREALRVTQEIAALDSPAAIEKARAAVQAASSSALAADNKEIRRAAFYKEDPVLAKLRQARAQAIADSSHTQPVQVPDLPAFLLHPASQVAQVSNPHLGDFSLPTPLRHIVHRNKQFLGTLRSKDGHAPAAEPDVQPKEDPTTQPAPAAPAPAHPAVKSEIPDVDAMQVDTAPPPEARPALPSDAQLPVIPDREDDELQMDDELANEILRQCVGVQAALHGFDRVQELALDVLTSATEIFTERIGFLVRSFVDVPGTQIDLVEALQNSFAEVFPHGVLTLRDYVVQDTYKFNNRLQNLPQSEVEKWLKLSGRSAADSVQVSVGSLYRDYFLQSNPLVKKNPDSSKLLQQLPTIGIIQAPSHVASAPPANMTASHSAAPPSLPLPQGPPQGFGQPPQPPQNQIPVQAPMQQYVPVGAPPRMQPHMGGQDMHAMHPESPHVQAGAGRPKKPPGPHVVPVMSQPGQPMIQPGSMMGSDPSQRPIPRGPGRPPRNPPVQFQGPPQMPPQISSQPLPVQHAPMAPQPVGSGPQLVHHGAPLGSHGGMPPHGHPPHPTIQMRSGQPMMSQVHHDDHSGEYHHAAIPRTPQTPQTPGSAEGEGDDGRQRRSRQRQNYGDYLMEDDNLSDDFEDTEEGKKKKGRKAAGRGTPARKK